MMNTNELKLLFFATNTHTPHQISGYTNIYYVDHSHTHVDIHPSMHTAPHQTPHYLHLLLWSDAMINISTNSIYVYYIKLTEDSPCDRI